MTDIADPTRTELEAAAFRRLVAHLRERTDVQNIDLMNLAGFCRNCLGNWYAEAANERGLPLTRDDGREKVYGMPYAEHGQTITDPEARETIYGMPYKQWQAQYQKEATPDQKTAFASSPPSH